MSKIYFIYPCFIKLVGFSQISNIAVFKFLPGGIFIENYDPNKIYHPWHHIVDVQDGIIYDGIVLAELASRGFPKVSEFIYMDRGHFYMERDPHPRYKAEL
ncbi:MAG: hypothetical protein ACI4QR_02330 [Eubacteriales bacterium]